MNHKDVPWGEYGEFTHKDSFGNRSKKRKGILIKDPISKRVWFSTNNSIDGCGYTMHYIPHHIQNTYKYGIKFGAKFTNFTFRKLDI